MSEKKAPQDHTTTYHQPKTITRAADGSLHTYYGYLCLHGPVPFWIPCSNPSLIALLLPTASPRITFKHPHTPLPPRGDCLHPMILTFISVTVACFPRLLGDSLCHSIMMLSSPGPLAAVAWWLTQTGHVMAPPAISSHPSLLSLQWQPCWPSNDLPDSPSRSTSAPRGCTPHHGDHV